MGVAGGESGQRKGRPGCAEPEGKQLEQPGVRVLAEGCVTTRNDAGQKTKQQFVQAQNIDKGNVTGQPLKCRLQNTRQGNLGPSAKAGWGKGRYTVESVRNSVSLNYYGLISGVLSIRTTTHLLSSHSVYCIHSFLKKNN